MLEAIRILNAIGVKPRRTIHVALWSGEEQGLGHRPRARHVGVRPRRGGRHPAAGDEADLPGIGIQQDPIEYNSHTWHTNLDAYERIIEDDAQHSAGLSRILHFGKAFLGVLGVLCGLVQ